MPLRLQRTIKRSVEVKGIGLFSGADVHLRFLPAADDQGIVFRRTDLPGSPQIPAMIANVVSRTRRTAIAKGGVLVDVTEHVLAALYGLCIDNCIVELDAPEPPGCDGSSLVFADALMKAEIERQSRPRKRIVIDQKHVVTSEDGKAEIVAQPACSPSLTIHYQLDYGSRSPIAPQALSLEITPQTFLNELAFARTFLLESEVAGLKSLGYGRRVTPKDLLVFSEQGVVGNKLRSLDECVRHKILDCVGDFALSGCDIHGHFFACRSGHRLNREIIGRIHSANESVTVGLPARAA